MHKLIRAHILANYWNWPADRLFDESDADDMIVDQFDPFGGSPRGALEAGAKRGDWVITDQERMGAEVVRIVDSQVVSIYGKA